MTNTTHSTEATTMTTVTTIIARRTTADGIRVTAYEDGVIELGYAGYTRPGYPLAALWLALGEIAAYGQEEVPKLLKAARAAVKQTRRAPLADLRARMG